MYNRPDDKQFKNDKKKSMPRAPQEEHDYRKDYKTKPVKKDGPKEEFQKRKKDKDIHSPNKEKYPDYKPKPKDDEGGTKVPKKPAPKSPMSPAAKKLKRTASRSK